MRLMKLLNSGELEIEIKNGISKVPDIKNISNLKFEKNISNGEDGLYIYADLQGYHYVFMERGIENIHKLTDDVFEICFWCFFELASNAAFDYEFENRDESRNYREVAFNKLIEYLSLIGDDFKKRGEIEIDNILKVNPY